jgi:hypothetical protein
MVSANSTATRLILVGIGLTISGGQALGLR